MSRIGYTYQGSEEKTVKAQLRDVRISPKESYEIANAIRGLNVATAQKMLTNVTQLKEPIPYRRYIHRSGVGHRPGHFGPGRYPKNSSEEFIKLLNLLEANAKFKGMNTGNLMLKHVAAHKGADVRHSFKGSPHSTSTTHLEIVAIEQIQETKPKVQKKKEGVKK